MDKRDRMWYYKYVGPLLERSFFCSFLFFCLLSDEIGGLFFLRGRQAELRLTQGNGLH